MGFKSLWFKKKKKSLWFCWYLMPNNDFRNSLFIQLQIKKKKIPVHVKRSLSQPWQAQLPGSSGRMGLGGSAGPSRPSLQARTPGARRARCWRSSPSFSAYAACLPGIPAREQGFHTPSPPPQPRQHTGPTSLSLHLGIMII